MDQIINWFILIIIFVFDPLAVALVVAFNNAVKVDKGEKDKKKVVERRELYGESDIDNRKESDLWSNTLQDGLDTADDINDLPWDENDDSGLDLDGDGIISDEERVADTDGDGKISEE